MRVVVDTAGEAAGMASMIASLIEANLASSPFRSRLARWVRGGVLLEANDRALGVTVSFTGDLVAVSARRAIGLPAMRGPWLVMSRVCSGLTSPLRALLTRELRVTLSRPWTVLIATAVILKVPRSVYRRERSLA